MRVTPTREDRDLGSDFLGEAAMGAAAVARILALGILPHDHPIQIARADARQRRSYSRQYPGRPHVGVLIKALANRQPEAPESDVVGHIGSTDRAKEDSVETLQLRHTVLGHHPTMGLVVV